MNNNERITRQATHLSSHKLRWK